MKPKFRDYYMQVAEATALLSTARRLQVGAVIVRDHKILATGYNGTPAGWDNNCEDKQYMDRDAGGWLSPEEIEESWPLEDEIGRYRLKTKPEVLHAESNSLMKVARSTESSEGATLFCTHAPCLECAKLIYQSGIRQLFYRDGYRDSAGLDFLQQGGIEVEQYQSDKNPG